MGFQAQRPPRSMTVLAFLTAPMARSLGNCTLGTGKCPAVLTVAGCRTGQTPRFGAGTRPCLREEASPLAQSRERIQDARPKLQPKGKFVKDGVTLHRA